MTDRQNTDNQKSKLIRECKNNGVHASRDDELQDTANTVIKLTDTVYS